MRIAFVSLNQEQLPDPVIPIGLLYIKANTPDHHEAVFWDLCFEQDPLAFLRGKLKEFKPDLFALGMRNLQNSDYSGCDVVLSRGKEVIDFLREASSAPIVLGGSGFSVMPEGLMKRLRPDFGISGEGETAFPALLAELESERPEFSQLSSLYFFRGDELLRGPRVSGFLDMNSLSSPDLTVTDSRYFSELGTGSVQTKRGCPLKCSYCTYPTIEGAAKRLRDPVRVVDELFDAIAGQPSLGHFFIVDSVFNLPKSHAKEICREMIRRRWSVPWTCYINPLGFDEELTDLMVRARCAGIEVGSDSGCDRVLKRLCKGFTTQHIRELSRISKAAGLKDCHSFILGTPGETLDDVRQTCEFIDELNPYCAILGIWVDDYEALDWELAVKRKSLRDEVKVLLADFASSRSYCVIPSLGVNFDEKFFAFLRRRKFRGPLWQHIRQRPGDASTATLYNP